MDIHPLDSWRPRSSPPELHRTLPVRRQDESAPIARREMQMSPPLSASIGVPCARAFRVLGLIIIWFAGGRAGSRFFLAGASAALGAMVPFAHRSGLLFAPRVECRFGDVQNACADAFGVGRIVRAVDILID